MSDRFILIASLLTLLGGVGLFILFGYLYCAGAVTYLMLTGQCELLEQRPDEW